ncbi:rhamnogalacturonan acetylesterase [Arcicella aquatica]|uniref:Rhamnogalacturonan acetylesterase n=1 Tax=Arcicella aquatica TaxID=217141 RepID=A0ABU5QGG7_9BACT|nr:rhamnogalacturonan acetylesterase [Arcicella aquatica]MEA5256147.1 rhamnogalacturonan acetylesterase [Arcicella aquatica]
MNKFKGLLLGIIFTFSSLYTFAQLPTSFKFDFGAGKVAKGYTQVLPESVYTKEKGFGFLPNAPIVSETRKGKDALTSDFCTSTQSFYFTVDIPEGNYNVKLYLGDTKGTSTTTVKVENRRLMLEKVITPEGKVEAKEFTVNVRTPRINDTESVKLKPREFEYLHWDNQLTFEFADVNPKICGLEITKANDSVITVFLAGNSTVVDQIQEPYAAWGQMIPRFFKAKDIVFANYAESGETIKSFAGAKRLDKVMSLMKAGDYFFIEFAHNDQKAGSGVEANTTYKEFLRSYIQKTKEKGGIPVLVTSMLRRNFDDNGKIINTLGDFPDAMRQVAKDENVALIDLNAMSKVLFETMGPEKSMKAFVHYEANTFPEQTKAIHDNTHFSNYGAYEIAKCIIEGIKQAKLGIATSLISDLPSFDPAHPDEETSFSLPHSPLVHVVKPDGN